MGWRPRRCHQMTETTNGCRLETPYVLSLCDIRSRLRVPIRTLSGPNSPARRPSRISHCKMAHFAAGLDGNANTGNPGVIAATPPEEPAKCPSVRSARDGSIAVLNWRVCRAARSSDPGGTPPGPAGPSSPGDTNSASTVGPAAPANPGNCAHRLAPATATAAARVRREAKELRRSANAVSGNPAATNIVAGSWPARRAPRNQPQRHPLRRSQHQRRQRQPCRRPWPRQVDRQHIDDRRPVDRPRKVRRLEGGIVRDRSSSTTTASGLVTRSVTWCRGRITPMRWPAR